MECYFFPYADSKHKVSDHLIAKGIYSFSSKTEHVTEASSSTDAIPYLTLNYSADTKGNFTDATIPPTPHNFKFEMENGITSYAILGLIQRYLDVDWKELVEKALTRSEHTLVPTLKTTIDNTDYTIIGILNTYPEIPENILE